MKSIKVSPTSFLILVLCLLSTEIFSQQLLTTRSANYKQQELQNLFLSALSTLSEEKIPSEYRSQVSRQPGLKCPTFLLLDVKRNLDLFSPDQRSILQQIFARPQLPFSYVNSAGKFKIHYGTSGPDSVSIVDSDNSQIPDWVEEVANALDSSYQVQVGLLGYQKAPDDLGIDGPEYDVYIRDIRSNYGYLGYGFAERDTDPKTPQESFIVMDNDFEDGHPTIGIDGARVTAAHEYFHAIQFGYRSPFITLDEVFYYELCSTWMEEVVYDSINDYYQYLPNHFRRRHIPFNQLSGYGEVVWNLFLEKKFGERTLLRRTWEIMQTTLPVMEAIDRSLKENDSSFEKAFVEFAVWNYFTGDRADSISFYEEGAAYPQVTIADSFDLGAARSVSGSSRALTFKYYKFDLLNSGAISITGSAESPENWKFVAIIIQPGGDNDWRMYDSISGVILGCFPGGSEIAIIPVNTLVLDGGGLPLSFNFEIRNDPSEECSNVQGLTDIYPNPFFINQHREMVFEFGVVSSAEFEVQIFTADGRVIKTASLNDGSGALGASKFIWDGRDNNNEMVASGIYIFQLKQDGFHQFKKFAVIHE